MKECRKCNETKEIIEFSKSKTTKDGLASWCRQCVNQATYKYKATARGKEVQKENAKRFFKTDKGKQITMKYKNSWGAGVYGIFVNNECFYVGESNTLRHRISTHYSRLKNPKTGGKHKTLYENLSQYNNVEIKVLEETSNHKEREQYWITQLNPKFNK
jgi:hypothetical protein